MDRQTCSWTGDFQLTAQSAAIDNAWEATAIPTDLLGNSQVKISGDGYGLPGFGPRDVGAFEFDGTGGTPVGGSFRVVTTSVVPVGGAEYANGSTLVTSTAPTAITLTFSGNVDHNSISATDLVLSGTAVNPSAAVHATSLTWIDGDTVQFNLSGGLDLPGTLDVSVQPNTIHSVNGQGNLSYSDNVVIQVGTPPAHVNPTPMPVSPSPTPTPVTPTPISTPVGSTPTPAPAPSPAPAARPSRKKHHVHVKPVAHPKPTKHVVAHHKSVKHAASSRPVGRHQGT